MDIVSWTFANDKYDQDQPLYIDTNDPSQWLSANQCRKLVRQLIAGFDAQGLKKGETVCVVSFNDIHYSAWYLGIIGSGACFTGANPGYTASELAHHLRITEAKFVLADPKTLATASAAADECGIPRSRVYVLDIAAAAAAAAAAARDDGQRQKPNQVKEDEKVKWKKKEVEGTKEKEEMKKKEEEEEKKEVVGEGPGQHQHHPHQSWSRLLEHGERDWARISNPDVSAAYVSTSGTSGLPKAAILPHSYLISQAKNVTRESSVSKKISYLVALPPFHVFTIPVQHAVPLRRGLPLYVMSRFDLTSFVGAIRRFRISRTIAVPPILMSLSGSAAATDRSLKSLRRIYVGGSSAGGAMQQALYEKLPKAARIIQVYGMTETGWITSWQDRKRDTTGSVGTAIPGMKTRLVGRDGQIIRRDGVNGEIQAYSTSLMKGYLNNAKATAEAFSSDGWVRTGDVGYVRDGKWYVIDRTKDLIKVRGWQVSPAEIEATLQQHPEVADAAVIGVAAADGSGEVPQAFVVVRSNSSSSSSSSSTTTIPTTTTTTTSTASTAGTKPDEKELIDFLRARLARYKIAESVKFVASIPRNPTGKILRRVLRGSLAPQAPTADQLAASAYSRAIIDLEMAQQRREAALAASDRCSLASRTGSLAESQAGSLTDASTVDSDGVASPRNDEDDLPLLGSGVKRSLDLLQSELDDETNNKRRSNRVSVQSAITI